MYICILSNIRLVCVYHTNVRNDMISYSFLTITISLYILVCVTHNRKKYESTYSYESYMRTYNVLRVVYIYIYIEYRNYHMSKLKNKLLHIYIKNYVYYNMYVLNYYNMFYKSGVLKLIILCALNCFRW